MVPLLYFLLYKYIFLVYIWSSSIPKNLNSWWHVISCRRFWENRKINQESALCHLQVMKATMLNFLVLSVVNMGILLWISSWSISFSALQVSAVAFDSYWSPPSSDDAGENVMYRFGSVGQVSVNLYKCTNLLTWGLIWNCYGFCYNIITRHRINMLFSLYTCDTDKDLNASDIWILYWLLVGLLRWLTVVKNEHVCFQFISILIELLNSWASLAFR